MSALLYFLIWAVVIFLMMRLGCGAHVLGHGSRKGEHDGSGDRSASENVRWIPPESDIDPVCGKTVHTDRAKPSVYNGTVYYFCSRDCRELFEAAPELYVGQGALVPTVPGETDHVRAS